MQSCYHHNLHFLVLARVSIWIGCYLLEIAIEIADVRSLMLGVWPEGLLTA
jgi:hypothetical protein